MYVLYFLTFSLGLISWWYTEVHQTLDLAIWLDIVEIILLTTTTGVRLIWFELFLNPSVDLLGCQFSIMHKLILEPISWFMACARCHMVLSHKWENLFLNGIWIVSQVGRLVLMSMIWVMYHMNVLSIWIVYGLNCLEFVYLVDVLILSHKCRYLFLNWILMFSQVHRLVLWLLWSMWPVDGSVCDPVNLMNIYALLCC